MKKHKVEQVILSDIKGAQWSGFRFSFLQATITLTAQCEHCEMCGTQSVFKRRKQAQLVSIMFKKVKYARVSPLLTVCLLTFFFVDFAFCSMNRLHFVIDRKSCVVQ